MALIENALALVAMLGVAVALIFFIGVCASINDARKARNDEKRKTK